MTAKGGKHRLVDFVDLGEGHDLMSSLAGIPLFFFQKFVSVMYCRQAPINVLTICYDSCLFRQI